MKNSKTNGAKTHRKSAPAAPSERRHKSRVAAGLRLLPGMTYNEAGAWGRIVRDVREAIYAHCGGEQHITETLRLQARRVAVFEAELVFLEEKFARARRAGKEPQIADLEIYGRLSAHQRRASEPLGWQRTPVDITPPTLAEYAAKRGRPHPEEEIDDVVEDIAEEIDEIEGANA